MITRGKQRGFLYLTTGANGAGKTLFTLKEVQERALKESRPVCYNGRFDLEPAGPLAQWKKIDMKDWQAEPDGTIFFVDEAHNDFPAGGRGTRDAVPEYVRMLAEHRKRGFDFYLITQHPMNLDNFVRRLIGSPGWHRHLKRTFGADLVSRLEWAAVNPQCEKPGSGESGAVSMVPFPKEVYTWYRSAQLHTGKTRIPKVVWFTIAAFLAVPVLAYFAIQQIGRPTNVAAKVLKTDPAPLGVTASPVSGSATAAAVPKPLTVAEYVGGRVPRVEGLAYSAPVYDSVTQPVTAPYPAACVDGFNRRIKALDCKCYTQQGTALVVPLAMCRQIAQEGFFIDWQVARAAESPHARSLPVVAPVPAPAAAASAPVVPGASLVAHNAPSQSPEASRSSDGAAIGAMRNGQRRW